MPKLYIYPSACRRPRAHHRALKMGRLVAPHQRDGLAVAFRRSKVLDAIGICTPHTARRALTKTVVNVVLFPRIVFFSVALSSPRLSHKLLMARLIHSRFYRHGTWPRYSQDTNCCTNISFGKPRSTTHNHPRTSHATLTSAGHTGSDCHDGVVSCNIILYFEVYSEMCT